MTRTRARLARRMRAMLIAGSGAALGAIVGELFVHGGADAERASLSLACLAALLLFAELWRRRAGTPAPRRATTAVLLFLGGLGFAASRNWFQGHFDFPVHPSDFLHYYLGARYFAELGYTHLYSCTVAAVQELGIPTEGWTVRQLTDNAVVPIEAVASTAAACRDLFTEAEWTRFVDDVRALHEMNGARWLLISLNDHGFNAGPPWVLVPALLLKVSGLSALEARHLVVLDAALVAAAGWLLFATFGARVFAIAMLFLGLHAPNRYDWVGGSLLRMDWWFWSALLLVSLRRARPAIAGGAWAWSSALRIFPVVLGLGPLLGWLLGSSRGPARAAANRRAAGSMILGAAMTSLAILVTTAAVAEPVEAWRGFVANLRKHSETPSLNLIGLRTLLSHDAGRRLRDLEGPGAVETWVQLRADVEADDAALWLVTLLAATVGVALLARARRRPEVLAAASAALVPIALDLSCYYMAVLALLAVAARPHRTAQATMLAALLATQVLQSWSRASGQLRIDDYFAAMSAIDVTLGLTVLGCLVWRAIPALRAARLEQAAPAAER